MQTLNIYNSLTRTKERFEPLVPGRVGMYVCGPTVYSNVHLGNVRTFLTFDTVYRYLTFIGYQVRYVRNITDVGHLTDDADAGEDKIARKAKLENLEPMEIVQRYTNDFHDVMRLFNILPPSIEPTATGHIVEQIELIQSILDAGLAYESDGNVYFDVRKFNESHPYGALSGRKIDELLTQTRALDGQDAKRDGLDFALWKKADPSHLMHWPSPWSVGFPGWHLECSAMSTKYLGTTFDIHGGGMDLKFPHHECEIAQNVAAHGEPTPVRYWMHGNMLTVNGRKMAKSEGNGFTPEELLTGNHPLLERGYAANTVRFFMLQGHYASTLDFSNEALQAAEKGFERLSQARAAMDAWTPEGTNDAGSAEVAALEERCYAAMNDDFNTPVLISVLFDAAKLVHAFREGRQVCGKPAAAELTRLFDAWGGEVLGLVWKDNASVVGGLTEPLMDFLLQLRQQAKSEKNFALADQIRNALTEMGVQIQDGKDGTTWSQQ
jgi:cysteinyl-tRNA synthetase